MNWFFNIICAFVILALGLALVIAADAFIDWIRRKSDGR